MPYLQNAGVFLIQTIFGFFIVVFVLRVLLIAINAPFNQPLCRFVYLFTNPATMPLRKLIPRWRRLEISSLLIAYVLALLQLILLAAMFGAGLDAGGYTLRALADLLDWIVLVELVAIFAYCLLSFIPSAQHDSNFRLLAAIVEPVVRPFRRIVPAVGGLDFSCWFAAIALVLIRLLVIAPLADAALRL
ncbi:MAG: YggT family protein [Proteobacteria bacterium]|nr:YggT family protein [Pseudomonadota bacterium]